MKLTFATGNVGKFEEAGTILGERGYELERRDLAYPEVQAEDLETIAARGAEWVYERTGEPSFVEDSGLFVRSLEGFPGPYSSYVHSTLGNGGILKLLEGEEDREAYFKSVVAYCDGSETSLHPGKVEGEISGEERGEEGFGYDPIFVPSAGGETFAVDVETKNRLSHRRRSLEAFAEWLESS